MQAQGMHLASALGRLEVSLLASAGSSWRRCLLVLCAGRLQVSLAKRDVWQCSTGSVAGARAGTVGGSGRACSSVLASHAA